MINFYKEYELRRKKYNLRYHCRKDAKGCSIKIYQRKGTTEKLVISRDLEDSRQCEERAAADLLFLFPEV